MKRLHAPILRAVFGLCACAMLVCLQAGTAHAYQHTLENYHHTAWASESGLGSVFEVSQAQDGYLWLTTSKGVYRFDGVRFQPLGEATNNAIHDGDVDSVMASAFGGVWLTTRSHGLLLWKDNRVFDFPDRRCTQGRRPDAMVEDEDGSLWIEASSGLFHLHQGICEEVTSASGYPGGFPSAILLDRSGTLWVKLPTGELFYRRRGEQTFQRNSFGEAPVTGFAHLHQAPDGAVWLSDSHGLRIVSGGASSSHAPSNGRPTPSDKFGNFTFDSEGNLWAATSQGIERFTQAKAMPLGAGLSAAAGESYTAKDGLSSDNIWVMMVDREGNLWAATYSGIDQFRRNMFSTLNLPPSQDFQMGVAAGADGSVWVGSRSLPLTHVLADGTSRSYPETGQALTIHRDRHGDTWSSGRGKAALWHTQGSQLVPVPYPDDKVEVGAAIAFDRNDDIWLSTFGPNLFHRSGGVWKSETETLGRKPGVMGAMTGDDEGNVWFAFSNKVVEWDGHEYHRFSFPDGPLNISVAVVSVRGDRVWLGGAGGVELLRGGQFYKMRWQQETMPGRVVGLVETRAGDLWINGYSGVVRVPAAEISRWLNDPNYAVAAEQFDALDGLPGLAGERYPEPSLVQGPDGRLWFATTQGVARLDPATLESRRNHLPPPVAIEAIVVGEKNFMGPAPATLPAHTGSVEFDYTALSLSLPERVRFRYMLEGVDKEWQSASTRRQAFYTNLAPGQYRFRVKASNNDGVWNEKGAFVDFSIAPAFYQMWQFKAMLGVLLAVLLLMMVQMRISSVTAQMQARLAARSDERERIARELHDTLLQSLYGVMLQFHAIADRLAPQDSTRQILSDTLHRADSVMQEGRERVRNLRATQADSGSLINSLSTTGYQMQALRPVRFQVQTRGRPRPLKPDIQEELLLIGREALTNAFVHSQAQAISVEVIFRSRYLMLTVEDNGCGIDEAVLKAWGREGHWGLRGMRERAERFRGRLEITRIVTGGTRVSLRMPGRIVYARSAAGIRGLWRALRGMTKEA